eukprot:3971214-Amphidinium_carterae.2
MATQAVAIPVLLQNLRADCRELLHKASVTHAIAATLEYVDEVAVYARKVLTDATIETVNEDILGCVQFPNTVQISSLLIELMRCNHAYVLLARSILLHEVVQFSWHGGRPPFGEAGVFFQWSLLGGSPPLSLLDCVS